MTATGTLKHEHEIVLLVLEAAEREARLIRGTGNAHVAEIEEMVDFFANFVDRCHHGKEERHLFPRLATQGLPAGAGPVAVMLAEHEQGRVAVRAINDALTRVKGGDRRAADELADALTGYAALLRNHIFKENNVLFPMADQILSTQDQAELADAFGRLEVEEMGEGVHEKYHQLAHRLGKG